MCGICFYNSSLVTSQTLSWSVFSGNLFQMRAVSFTKRRVVREPTGDGVKPESVCTLESSLAAVSLGRRWKWKFRKSIGDLNTILRKYLRLPLWKIMNSLDSASRRPPHTVACPWILPYRPAYSQITWPPKRRSGKGPCFVIRFPPFVKQSVLLSWNVFVHEISLLWIPAECHISSWKNR